MSITSHWYIKSKLCFTHYVEQKISFIMVYRKSGIHEFSPRYRRTKSKKCIEKIALKNKVNDTMQQIEILDTNPLLHFLSSLAVRGEPQQENSLTACWRAPSLIMVVINSLSIFKGFRLQRLRKGSGGPRQS